MPWKFQWKRNGWTDYAEHVQVMLNKAYNEKQSEIQFEHKYGNRNEKRTLYSVNLTDMYQVNPVSGNRRVVRKYWIQNETLESDDEDDHLRRPEWAPSQDPDQPVEIAQEHQAETEKVDASTNTNLIPYKSPPTVPSKSPPCAKYASIKPTQEEAPPLSQGPPGLELLIHESVRMQILEAVATHDESDQSGPWLHFRMSNPWALLRCPSRSPNPQRPAADGSESNSDCTERSAMLD